MLHEQWEQESDVLGDLASVTIMEDNLEQEDPEDGLVCEFFACGHNAKILDTNLQEGMKENPMTINSW